MYYDFRLEKYMDEFSNDIYLIEKGIRDCAYETCDTDIYEQLKEEIEYIGLYVIRDKPYSDDLSTKFFIFANPITELGIKAYLTQTDYAIKEYLFCKLLGYTESQLRKYLEKGLKLRTRLGIITSKPKIELDRLLIYDRSDKNKTNTKINSIIRNAIYDSIYNYDPENY